MYIIYFVFIYLFCLSYVNIFHLFKVRLCVTTNLGNTNRRLAKTFS